MMKIMSKMIISGTPITEEKIKSKEIKLNKRKTKQKRNEISTETATFD